MTPDTHKNVKYQVYHTEDIVYMWHTCHSCKNNGIRSNFA